MKKVFIHIGAHKTASKTFQRNLYNNQDNLSEKNIEFLGSQECGKSDFGLHFRKLSKFLLDDDVGYSQSIESAKSAFEKLINNIQKENILLSWEGICGHSSLDKYKGIYTHNDMIADSLHKIFANYQTRILLVVRRQDDFIESCYLQQIKENRQVKFDDFLDQIDLSNLSWLKIAESLSGKFGNSLRVCPFEYIKEVGARGFIEYCLSSLFDSVFDASSFGINEKANASISKKGVDVCLDILPHVSKVRRAELNRMFFFEFSSTKFGKAKFFNEFHRKLIKTSCYKDNSILFDNYICRSSGNSKYSMKGVQQYWLN